MRRHGGREERVDREETGMKRVEIMKRGEGEEERKK